MPAQRAQRKRPGDFTGSADEKLKLANQEELERQAESMAMVNRVAAVQNSEVVDYTEEGRKASMPDPVDIAPVPVKNRKHRIRVVADIDQMTFGKNIVAPAEVTDGGGFRDAILGGLNHFDFKEGRQYDVDTPMFERLVHLGYVYGETCTCLQCQAQYGVSA